MKFPNKFVRLTSVITEDDDSTYKKLMKVLDEVSYFQVTLRKKFNLYSKLDMEQINILNQTFSTLLLIQRIGLKKLTDLFFQRYFMLDYGARTPGISSRLSACTFKNAGEGDTW